MADIEETRAVVPEGESYDGKIVPTEQVSLDRPVRIRADATVQGSVYGTSVSTDADATIEGSVMATEAVELTGGHVEGEVGTPGKVVCEDARIDGSVTGKKVRLQGCVVRGNVIGTDVILENSVVVGLATADRDLTLEDTICYSFRALDTASLDGAITVLPQAVVDGDLHMASPVRVAGLGALEVENEDRLPRMTEDDLYEDETTYLTLAPRILNLSKVEDRLAELAEGVMAVVNDTSDDDGSMDIEDLLGMLEADTAAFVDDVGGLS